MQQDAVRRVHEMQQRARQSMQNAQVQTAQSAVPPPQPQHVQQEQTSHSPRNTNTRKQEQHPAVVEHKQRNLLDLFNLKNLLKDSDTALILTILLLLGSDETDQLLILALIYIMF